MAFLNQSKNFTKENRQKKMLTTKQRSVLTSMTFVVDYHMNLYRLSHQRRCCPSFRAPPSQTLPPELLHGPPGITQIETSRTEQKLSQARPKHVRHTAHASLCDQCKGFKRGTRLTLHSRSGQEHTETHELSTFTREKSICSTEKGMKVFFKRTMFVLLNLLFLKWGLA